MYVNEKGVNMFYSSFLIQRLGLCLREEAMGKVCFSVLHRKSYVSEA